MANKLDNLKKGKKFGSGQATNLGGRKQSRINEVWKIVLGTEDVEDREIILPKSDKYKIIESLFEMSIKKLEIIADKSDTPAFIVNIIKAILGDIAEKRTFTIDKYYDRFFGKADTKVSLTGGEDEEGNKKPVTIFMLPDNGRC